MRLVVIGARQLAIIWRIPTTSDAIANPVVKSIFFTMATNKEA